MNHFNTDLEKERLTNDGISSLREAFSRDIGALLLADYVAERDQAIEAGITKNRGPNRIWFPARLEKISASLSLAMHPYVTEVSEAVMGPNYQVVELGFDEPRQGAKNQPWHRDIPLGDDIRQSKTLNCLAFNMSLKDVTPDMGPFEIAPGTQFLGEETINLARGMFVFKRHYDDLFAPEKVQKRMGRLGDIQVRTPLTFHRGTIHTSPETRPVMILGVAAPELDTSVHSLPVSEQWLESLTPAQQEFMEQHVRYQLVPELGTVTTPGTDVEELMMGNEDLIPV